MKGQRAALYARVSSQAQRDRHTIENQLRTLRAYIIAQGWTLTDTYVDDGRSAKTGKLDAREEFTRLLRDAEAKLFDVLVVVDIDRLTRTDDMTERAAILGPFQKAGIDIVTPSGGRLDMRTMLGELYVTMQALVAAEENRKRAERIKAGKLRAIAEGRKPAGPTPFGHGYDRKTGTWSIDAARAEILHEIFARVIAGESSMVIADDLYARKAVSPRGPWERHKVWALVRSRHVLGEWTADKKRRLVVRIPQIIDEVTWQDAQEALLAHGKRGLIKTRYVYLLEALAVCGRCGSPIAIRSRTASSPSSAAYVCRARKLARIGETRCGAPIATVADVDDRAWSAIARELDDPELANTLARRAGELTAEHRDWKADAAGYRTHLERLGRVEAGLLTRYRRGVISDDALDGELEKLHRERAAVVAQLETAERAVSEVARAAVIAPEAWGAALQALANSDSPQARQRVVRTIVRRGDAVLDEGRIRLTLRIEHSKRAAERTRTAPVLGVVPGYRSNTGTIDETVVRIRLVA